MNGNKGEPRWPAIAGLGAVFLAVVCCLGLPLLATFGVALIAGLASAWQPIVLGLAAVALLVASILRWRQLRTPRP